MDKQFVVKEEVIAHLLAINEEQVSVSWVNDDWLQIGFEMEYSKIVEEEFKRIFDFYDIPLDEDEEFQFAADWFLEGDEWKLGYSLYLGETHLEVDEFLIPELNELCMKFIKEELHYIEEMNEHLKNHSNNETSKEKLIYHLELNNDTHYDLFLIEGNKLLCKLVETSSGEVWKEQVIDEMNLCEFLSSEVYN